MTYFDTHRAVETIMATGVPKATAEAIVNTISSKSDDLTTKNDLKLSISEIRIEIKSLETEITKIKTDIIKWMLPFFLGIVALNITTIGIVLGYLIK